MFCPNCKSEYIEGIITCHDCGTPLVDRIPEEEHPKSRLVTVYSSGDPAMIALIKSLLDDASIFFFIKSEECQNLFGVGTIGFGFNPLTGPMEVMVREEEATTVHELLKELETVNIDSNEDPLE